MYVERGTSRVGLTEWASPMPTDTSKTQTVRYTSKSLLEIKYEWKCIPNYVRDSKLKASQLFVLICDLLIGHVTMGNPSN